MRKSVWLLSAGLFALATPAFAQDHVAVEHGHGPGRSPADRGRDRRSRRRRQPGGRARNRSTPATSSSPRLAATRRCPTFRWRSARSPPRRSRIRAPPTSASSTRCRRRCSFPRPRPKPARRVARIRGIGTVGDNPGLESSVGVFIDGVYRSRTGVGLTELGPLDRIEVLRGPQGTLFGRNTSAGLISIITAKPRFETGGQRPARRRQLRHAPARS